MTELNRQEQLTTADLAGRRGNFADNPDLQAETRNTVYHEEYVAANPLRPKVAQLDAAKTDLRNDAVPAKPETRSSRDWEAPRPTADASAVNDAAAATTSAPLFSDSDIGDLRSRLSRKTVGQRRQRLNRGSPRSTAALPRLLQQIAQRCLEIRSSS
jgi:hypothetical protein